MQLTATTPDDRRVPFPRAETWKRWAARVSRRVSPYFASDDEADDFDEGVILVATRLDKGRRPPNPMFWCGDPEARVECAPSRQLYLERVELAAWQGVFLPRQWDDPERWDETPEEPLADLFRRVYLALQSWSSCLDDLEARIRNDG